MDSGAAPTPGRATERGRQVADVDSMRIRDYLTVDLDSCLALFDSNVPEFFLPTEREAFVDFLQSADYRLPRSGTDPESTAEFYVLELDNEVVGCGGWYHEGQIAGLTWGIVIRSQQGKGLGRFLLQERLRRIRRDGRARIVRVRTTPAVQGFFEHSGFSVVREGVPGVVTEVQLVELTMKL